MKNPAPSQSEHRIAFTLVELLVVIAVIAILAALLFPVMNGIQTKRVITVAYGELSQVATAIEAYHARKGFYPPDNPVNVNVGPLLWELSGTIYTNDSRKGGLVGPGYCTRDGVNWVTTNTVPTTYGVAGFANSSSSVRGTDDAPASESFIKDLKPDQIKTYGAGGALVLACSEGWNKPGASAAAPWAYNSSHPTNNPGSYDLWVDLYIRGRTNRISNWSKVPQVVP